MAFLDILGFSNIVLSESPKYIENIFETIKKCKNSIKQDKCAWSSEYDCLSENTFVYIMSDSVVIAIKSDISGALDFLIRWCKEIQIQLLLKHKRVVRGGVSRGLYYQDREIAFGNGLVKAYKIENTAKYPRIVIDESIDSLCCADILEDEDKKKYIDFLGNSYWDDKEFGSLMSFAKEQIEKNESVIEKYQWLSKQFEKCSERYWEKKTQDEFCIKQDNSFVNS